MIRDRKSQKKPPIPNPVANGKKPPKVAEDSLVPKSQNRPDFPDAGVADTPLTFSRPDWTEFRDPARISNKAGVKWELLPKLVIKELVDNALDASGNAEIELLPMIPGEECRFAVSDDGEGICGSDAEIAARFSINRPLASSKTLRLPTRGMLGNGLRVVAGVVLVSSGELKVSTRGRTLTLGPIAEDGSTKVLNVEPWKGTGTRVEVAIRGDLARHADPNEGLFEWGDAAISLAEGSRYKGKSSPWWYDPTTFWELFRAAGKAPVERVIEQLEGCTSRERAATVAGAFRGRECSILTQDEAAELLDAARGESKVVVPGRLGKVGKRDDFFGYTCIPGTFERGGVSIPFVVEVWANKADAPEVTLCLNRTPVAAQTSLQRQDGNDYSIFGGGLRHRFEVGQKGCGEYRLIVNVTTPWVPFTSSGKDPDLTPMRVEVLEACQKAVRVAKRTAPKVVVGKQSQKAIIRGNIEAARTKLSGGGRCIFSLRQMFYFIRPLLLPALGCEPNYNTFGRIVGEYEDERGDIDGLYRDDRGVLIHPHTGESIQLGTRSIADYQRPPWEFRSILYSEKEGFFPLLLQAKWPERHDCALLTSKGFATRAVREALKRIKATGEPIKFFCMHDADGPGTKIFEALQRVLEPHGIEVVNIGLDRAEGEAMGLEVEPVVRKNKKKVQLEITCHAKIKTGCKRTVSS
jgi:hypothetical protein